MVIAEALVQPVINGSVQNIELLDPILQTFQPLFVKVTLIFGGLFGLYIFVMIINVYYQRQKVKILKDIRYDLDQVNFHQGIKTSHYNKKGVSKLWQKLALVLKSKWWSHKK